MQVNLELFFVSLLLDNINNSLGHTSDREGLVQHRLELAGLDLVNVDEILNLKSAELGCVHQRSGLEVKVLNIERLVFHERAGNVLYLLERADQISR